MKTSIFKLSNNNWSKHPRSADFEKGKAQLVLCFGSKEIMGEKDIYERVRQQFPHSQIALCSTAGEIFQDLVLDDAMVASAIHFDKVAVQTASVNIRDFKDSYEAATALVKQLPSMDLSYILVLSDGSSVNGSDLVKGLNDAAGNKILITGGLAGDGANFVSTLVGLNKQPEEGNILAIGFYGKNLFVTHGSQGGWDSFGPEREVTKSEGNILFEIDNKNALRTYEKYLGPDADNLPGSALLFPLSMTVPGNNHAITRTILSVDRKKSSMTFAGDIPVGAKVRFMKANFDKLTSAASGAAQKTIDKDKASPGFSLLVSCVGRKLILGPRIDEEVEAVKETIGKDIPIAGFYSYGEISPFNDGGACQLHNQTMTITTLYELP